MEVIPQKPIAGVSNPPVVRAALQFERKTEHITTKKGLTFGFTYKLVNPPAGADVPLETRITHPEFVLPSGQRVSTTRTRIIIHAADTSREFHVAYTFDEQFELVPGEWRLSLFHDGKELATKTFTVEPDREQ